MPQILDYRNQRLKDWVDNKEKSSETQSQPKVTQRTRFISRWASTRGTRPWQSYQRLWGNWGKPNQFTAIQLQMEKHHLHRAQMNQRAQTEPEEAFGEQPRPPARSSTAPLAWPASGTGRLLLTAGHAAPHLTSQALKVTSGNSIKSSPRGTLSPLLFLLTTRSKGRGTCVAHRSRWQAEEVLHLRCFIIQFSWIQWPFFGFPQKTWQ